MNHRNVRGSIPERHARWSVVATIVILDDDLGFLFWLGQALSAPQCRALPAVTVAEAAALIDHFKLEVNLLIMNPAIPGAVEFSHALRKQQKQLRVATLTGAGGADGSSPRHQPVLAREN
jgi:DNA-binding response OmpR family regulator